MFDLPFEAISLVGPNELLITVDLTVTIQVEISMRNIFTVNMIRCKLLLLMRMAIMMNEIFPVKVSVDQQ